MNIFAKIFGGDNKESKTNVSTESVTEAFNALPDEHKTLVAQVAQTYQKPAEPVKAEEKPAEPEQTAVEEKATEQLKAEEAKPATQSQPQQPTGKSDISKVLEENNARATQLQAQAQMAQSAAQPKPAEQVSELEKPQVEYVSTNTMREYTAKLEQILEQQNKQISEYDKRMTQMQNQFSKFLNPEREYSAPLATGNQAPRTTHEDIVRKYIGGRR